MPQNKNNKPTIMVVYGTRPESVKLARLVEVLRCDNEFNTFICCTGQQKDLLENLEEPFDLKPDCNLSLMKNGESFESQKERYTAAVTNVAAKLNPDAIIVQGDTVSALAGAKASFLTKTPLFHIEAGLRTNNPLSPFPEEIIRTEIARYSVLNFAPTENAVCNLISEAAPGRTIVTGNTEIDALEMSLNHKSNLADFCSFIDYSKKIIILTLHRRENKNNRIKSVYSAIKNLAKRKDVQIVYPVHPDSVFSNASNELRNFDGIYLIKPLSPVLMHKLINCSYLILTDSGGLQEDCAYLQKPVIILRDETERKEIIETGAGVITGTDESKILESANILLDNEAEYQSMRCGKSLFGDGQASIKIHSAIREYFGLASKTCNIVDIKTKMKKEKSPV